MAITRTAWTDDSGTGTDGTIINNAEKTTIYNQIDALVGEWTSVTFAAGDYTASSGNWTLVSGDVIRNRYAVINKQLFWIVMVTTTTVSATPSGLRIAIPTGSFATTNQACAVAYMNDNGTVRECYAQPNDGTHLQIVRKDGGNFATATDTTAVYFQGVFELA